MKGFFKKYLFIDMSKRTFKEEPIQDHILQDYMGAKGLATHLLLEKNPAGIDPFSRESNLIISLGPLTDSPIHGSCRYGIYAKSPLTGLYGESYSGGTVAVPMSRTGYDAFVITGESDKPVWLEISDNGVKFHDATDLWGKDTYSTEDEVTSRLEDKKGGVIVIGPAGEQQVRFAVIENNYWRSGGRTGMGAILGSKKIKAIAFHGEQKRPFHNLEGLKAFAKNALTTLKDHQVSQHYRKFGTPSGVELINKVNAFPTQNWTKGTCDHWKQIDSESLIERCAPRPRACRNCFIACGRFVNVQSGRHQGLKMDGPEFETISAFGGLCFINKIEDIVYLNDLCDRLGLDTISAGNVVAFAIEASKKGKLDGDFEYGDKDMVVDLLHKIANREGIGDLLAEGVKVASAKLGLEDIAVHVKGLEPPGFEPRSLRGMALAYAVSERGACHLRSTFYKADFQKSYDPEDVDNTVEVFLDFENLCTLRDVLITCHFYSNFYQWDAIGEMLEMATGVSLNKSQLENLANRVKDETRMFNIREGLTKADDRLPKRLVKESIEGAEKIDADFMERLVETYYLKRGWDLEGVPVKD